MESSPQVEIPITVEGKRQEEEEELPPKHGTKQQRNAFPFPRVFSKVRQARNEAPLQNPSRRGYPQQPQQVVGGQPVYVQNESRPRPQEASRMNTIWRGLTEDSEEDIESIHFSFGSQFNRKEIRNKFIRKVYLLLTVLLLYTAGIIGLCVFESHVRIFLIRHWWIGFICMVVFLILYIVLLCVESTRKNFPLNFLLLCVFTFFAAFGFGSFAANYSPEIVLYAAAITAGICALITLLACQTWIDVTGCGGLIFILAVALMILGFVILILQFVMGYSRVLDVVYSGIAAFVVCVYFLYITQLILGGKRYELSPEEYILAVIILYTEIMQLFMLMLRLLGGGRQVSIYTASQFFFFCQ